MEAKDYKRIPLKPETHKRLGEIGKKSETFDALINRLCDKQEEA